MVQEPKPHEHSQNSSYLVVDCLLADLPRFDRGQKLLTKESVVRHLDVEAIVGRLNRAVRGAPVGNDKTVESPFAFEYVLKQMRVL